MRERGGLSLNQVARLRQFYTREREKEEEEEEEGEREEEERKVEKAIPRTRPFSFEKLLKSTLEGADKCQFFIEIGA